MPNQASLNSSYNTSSLNSSYDLRNSDRSYDLNKSYTLDPLISDPNFQSEMNAVCSQLAKWHLSPQNTQPLAQEQALTGPQKLLLDDLSDSEDEIGNEINKISSNLNSIEEINRKRKLENRPSAPLPWKSTEDPYELNDDRAPPPLRKRVCFVSPSVNVKKKENTER